MVSGKNKAFRNLMRKIRKDLINRNNLMSYFINHSPHVRQQTYHLSSRREGQSIADAMG